MRKSLLLIVFALGCIGLQAQNYHIRLHQSGSLVYDNDVNNIQEIRFQGSQPAIMVINANTPAEFPITHFDSITCNLQGGETTQYNIIARANNDAWGTVTGGGVYDAGATCTLVATPAWGYVFESWKRNGEVVSTNPTYSFTVTESASFTAIFADEEPPQPVGDTVRITYNGGTANIVNPFSSNGVSVTNSGANVTVNSTMANVPYVVSGSSTNGSLTINSSNPLYLALSSLSLTSTTTAAINIASPANVTLALRGTNTLADAASNTLEGAFCAGGNVTLSGGDLQLTGNAKHALSVEGTLTISSGHITVANAVTDGLHCNTLVYSEATYTVNNCGSDGIETSGDCTINNGTIHITSTAFDSKGISANGSFFMKNGTLETTMVGTMAKGVKADGQLNISGGTITMNLSGDSSNALSSDTELVVSGGNITIVLSAIDSKGLNSNGTLNVSNGDITITASQAECNGMKADGDLTVSGGTIHVTLNGQNSNALSTETALNVTGGGFNLELKATKCKGLNSNGTMTISNNCNVGITAMQTECKGIKADNNLTINGGTINATLSSATCNAISSETALSVTGGNLTLNLNSTDCKGLNSNGTISVSGGTVNIPSTGAENKAIKADGNITISGGTITSNISGNNANGISSDTNVTISGTADITVTSSSLDGKGIKSDGTLNINGGTIHINHSGNTSKGISSDSDLTITAGTIVINSTGTTVVTSGDPSYCTAIKSDTNIAISGGNITIVLSSANKGGKGIKATGTMNISGNNTIDITTNGDGATYTATSGTDVYSSTCLRSEGNMSILGGNITLRSTGAGGKGIKVGKVNGNSYTGTYTQGNSNGTGPTLTVTTTGGEVGSSGGGWGPGGGSSSSAHASAKAIKVNGLATIYGGTTTINTSGTGAEGLESKTQVNIEGGQHYIKCKDDCINSKGKIFFNGGVTVCYGFGNDAVDSNAGQAGAITIGNGVAFAYTTKGDPEEGFDCDNNSYIRITGTGIGISAGGSQGGGGGGWPGGGGSGNTISGAVQGYYFHTSSYTFQTGKYYTLSNTSGSGGTNLVTFSFEANCTSKLALITATGMAHNTTYYVKYGSAAPSNPTTAFHGLYLGGTSSASTQAFSFTAQ